MVLDGGTATKRKKKRAAMRVMWLPGGVSTKGGQPVSDWPVAGILQSVSGLNKRKMVDDTVSRLLSGAKYSERWWTRKIKTQPGRRRMKEENKKTSS